MKPSERGFLVGLAILLLGACVFVALQTLGGKGDPGGPIDSGRVPAVTALRTSTTPGGVEVLVLADGRGEERAKGEPMDIAFVGYSAASGAKFQQNIKLGLVLEDGGVIEGWIEGLQGMKRGERRRLKIPAALAYGTMRHGNIMPNSDLIFDVQWAALDIQDLVEGTGDAARDGDTIKVIYTGTLEDGRIFDGNVGGDPVEFPLARGGLIQGWLLGVPGMRVGGKRRLWIPWHLAYGEQERPGRPGRATITPYSNLVFEIELLGVK
ncbi:MAG: FKBP-type peptidyl-prolyl cis-trans isomerase [Planctomycetota bacterium]|nr:FKBP-type peptidyl-prolyl cis-trans isomerase [Planctomycetota bacterium]